MIAAPIPFIKLATNAQAQAYNPTWVGPGTTNGFQVVAQAGCPAIGPAKFLSPFPQLDAIDELDPDYRPAYRKYVGNNPDDIGILNWGMNKTIHQMLEATGRDLSRQSFLKAVTSGRVFHSERLPRRQLRRDDPVRGPHRPPAGGGLRRPAAGRPPAASSPTSRPTAVRQALVIGIVAGSGYGLIALGLVLVYKSSGIFNFAQGEFGTVAVFGLWGAHSAGVPYGLAMLAGARGRPGQRAGHRTLRRPARCSPLPG